MVLDCRSKTRDSNPFPSHSSISASKDNGFKITNDRTLKLSRCILINDVAVDIATITSKARLVAPALDHRLVKDAVATVRDDRLVIKR